MVKELIAPQGQWLSPDALRQFVHESLAEIRLDGRSILFIIPDHTRSMPMPLMFRALCEACWGKTSRTDFLIALGTHPPMTDEMIHHLLGITARERTEVFGDIGIFNHAWKDPNALTEIGWLSAEEIETLSSGLMHEAVRVTLNKRVLDYDVVCIVGPVFPHEVVGFSGGNKYFFPGVAGEEILNMFHWLGALITNYAINGTKYTPVRAVVDRAAALIPVEKWCFCLTQVKKDTRAIFFGSPEAAWDKAADLSAETHIIYKPHPFRRVLAMAAPMYDELWVAGKCMYKLEPVVADGGELIIFGKHVKEVSITHGALIRRIGYHVRDYFLKQMDRFHDIPGGILAHSTHVKGMGTFENGVEIPRITVTLATSIPEEVCREINLGYRNPDSIDPREWENREEEGLLLVRDAGEILYRVRPS